MKILDIIIFTLVCIITTAIMIFAVVVQYPEEFTSYLALSFALVLDGFLLFMLIPSRPRKKPKTVSKPLVFWLSVVLYCCFFATGFLADAYINSAKAVTLVFGCIFTAIGLASVVWLIYLFVGYLKIKRCLKHGKETTAEFVEAGKDITFEYGKPQTNSHFTLTRYAVVFKYLADGQEKTATSKRVFSKDEIEQLQTMQTFKIKYIKSTAVIDEIFEA